MPVDELFDDISNLGSDEDIAIALGNMVVVWAYAEGALSHALSVVSGMPTQMAMESYYRIPTYEARTKFLQSLITNWDNTHLNKEKISKCIAALNRLAGARNKWIHGIWAKGQQTGTVVTFHLREKDLQKRKDIVHINNINVHCCAVEERANQLYALIERAP